MNDVTTQAQTDEAKSANDLSKINVLIVDEETAAHAIIRGPAKTLTVDIRLPVCLDLDLHSSRVIPPESGRHIIMLMMKWSWLHLKNLRSKPPLNATIKIFVKSVPGML